MMKHKSNQTAFLILIPLFIISISFIFDFVMIYIQDTRLAYTTKSIMKDALTYNTPDYYEAVKEQFQTKKMDTTNLEVHYDENTDQLTVYNSIIYTSFFGKVIGKKNYRSEINLIGYQENDQYIFKEVAR